MDALEFEKRDRDADDELSEISKEAKKEKTNEDDKKKIQELEDEITKLKDELTKLKQSHEEELKKLADTHFDEKLKAKEKIEKEMQELNSQQLQVLSDILEILIYSFAPLGCIIIKKSALECCFSK